VGDSWLSEQVEQHPDVIDFGDNVYGLFQGRHGYPDGVRVGMFVSHRRPSGEECCGSVQFDVPEAEGLKGPRWQVESWDPLTISPSILCGSCGHHGYIRQGRWESC
jgi:hypothetical protein